MTNWADQALEICERFNALIIPLYHKGQPATKLNPNKPANKNLPPYRLPSSDPDIINQWAEKFTGYGVVPGDKFLIVDVDIKEGQNGKKSIKFMVENGLPSTTYTVKSPSGGIHLYYQHPTHYKPSQSVGGNVKFEDSDAQQVWNTMQQEYRDTHNIPDNEKSTGIDTRYGWGYVVGPGSVFEDQEYVIVCEEDLASVPSNIWVGFGNQVTVTGANSDPVMYDQEIAPGSIKLNRNDHARDFTFRLRDKRYPDSHVKSILKDKVKIYDNSDGEAPTVDDMWDMYIRAKDKHEDVIGAILIYKIFIVKGEKVLDLRTMDTVKFCEFRSSLANKKVGLEILKNNGDMSIKQINPADSWFESPERITVQDIIFDIRLDHGLIKVNEDDDHCHFNTFVPPKPIPLEGTTRTENGMYIYECCIRLIQNVFTNPEDREWFRAWIGLMLFEPGSRPAWGFHIFSKTHGVGKDTLAEVITSLYGKSNVKRIGMESFLDKSNIEFFNTSLIVMSDFQRIRNRESAIMAKFKELTGASSGRRRAMYSDGSQGQVSVRFLMFSNYEHDFPVEKQDRRVYKSRCEGHKLPEDVTALTNYLADPKSVGEARVLALGVGRITEADLTYARAKLFDYFYQSNWAKLPNDCPHNQTKEDSLIVDTPVYFEEFKRYIELEAFVFASDIVTEDSIRLMARFTGLKTSVGSILTALLEHDVIHRVDTWRKKSDPSKGVVPKKINVPGLEYDPDLDRITTLGKPRLLKCYYVRNADIWELSADKDMDELDKTYGSVVSEYKKIIDHPSILRGYDASKEKYKSKVSSIT